MGLPLDFDGLPDDLSDYTAPAAPLASLKFGGFTNTRVAAGAIGKATLGTVVTSNGGNELGLAADTIKSLAATGSAGKINLPADGSETTDGDFVLRLLA